MIAMIWPNLQIKYELFGKFEKNDVICVLKYEV
jgi:hypothetical protein